MVDSYVSCNLEELLVGEPLPATIYLYIDFRFITFRAEGDVVDRSAYERLELKKVRNVFIQEKDRAKFTKWARSQSKAPQPAPLSRENRAFAAVREEARRTAMDIFQTQHPDRAVVQAMEASKKLMKEVIKFPFAVQTLGQLQNYSRGMADHSVNVAVLGTYLAMQMGYSHALILQYVGAGGLLHDIGKTQIRIEESDEQAVVDEKMKAHPELGVKLFEVGQKLPNEVRMIIAQHHEVHDGTGYPKKLKGNQIYDLARIVAIANRFDGLVGNGKGTLVERQRAAIRELDENLYKEFDPQKLEKALKILRLGV